MGIQNLLPFIKKSCRQSTIDEIRNNSVAIDVSCLLHRGIFGCMEQIAQGEETTFYIYYVNKYIKELLDLGCHVIMVFDGRPLPAKKDTNDERRQRREDNIRAGEVLLSEGKKEEALDKFKRATSITSDIVEKTIQHFRGRDHVDILVSPYESDAQLAFLTKEGLADVVITEDSDLVAFGCEKIIFKWNVDNGQCTVYEKQFLYKCFSGEMSSKFDFVKFRRICILTGCDYLQAGLPGVGLAKAVSFFSKTQQTDLRALLPRIPSYLKMSKLKVTKDFIEDFIRAENTFLHQIVFDPRTRSQRPLYPYDLPEKKENKENDDEDDDFVSNNDVRVGSELSYAGCVMGSSHSIRLALGNKIDPNVESVNDKFLLPNNIPEWSVWSDGSYKTEGEKDKTKKEEIKKKSKSCGAFVLDSPSKKVRKRAIDMDDIVLGDTPEKKIPGIKKFLSTKTTELSDTTPEIKKPSAKRIKNEADFSWNIDEMMALYTQEKATKPSSDEKQADHTVSETKTEVLEVKETKESTDNDDKMTSSVRVTATFQKANSLNDGKTQTATVTKVTGKSSYFLARSGGCSNPFKRPATVLPSSDIAPSPKTIKSTPSALSSLDDGNSVDSSLNSFKFSPIARVGFRPQGLRKSSSK